MFETPLTIVGNLVADPIRRVAGTAEVTKFRVASNSRRPGADGSWENAGTLFVNVNCWNRLVVGAAASLKKGDRVIAVGTVTTNEYVSNDGVPKSSLEMRASAVGPDLSSCIARVQKLSEPAEPAAAHEPPEDEPEGRYDDGYPGEEIEPEQHPLSA